MVVTVLASGASPPDPRPAGGRLGPGARRRRRQSCSFREHQ